MAIALFGHGSGRDAQDEDDFEDEEGSMDLDEAPLRACTSRAEVWSRAWEALGAPYTPAPARCRTLVLEGIDPNETVHLVSLSLAALEQAVSVLVGQVSGEQPPEAQQARCATLLTHVARAAARAWLGYVPEGLCASESDARGAQTERGAEPLDSGAQRVDADGLSTRLAETGPLYAAVLRLVSASEPWLGYEGGDQHGPEEATHACERLVERLSASERRRRALRSLSLATRARESRHAELRYGGLVVAWNDTGICLAAIL
ncbi:hypothetical protein QBZ16_000758 [Prototheca wickerhamii]|uniref:Uncharacterized protein n=1 Tax=Prototheca wickerhamii TaxID=3111 RepID=A0AAD9INT8_PROWI|nr:hypothetical protein QBZ16_000758 [Prototheca wickerhamii]